MSPKIRFHWQTALVGMVVLMTLMMLAMSRVSYAADDADHDRARQAVEAGDVLPLRTILERVERDYHGQVMEVELDRENGEWIYDIKVLRKGGALVKLKIHAKDGTILGLKEKRDKQINWLAVW